MKTIFILLTCCLALGVGAPPANAQEEVRFGLGIGLSGGTFIGGELFSLESLGPSSLYFPITFANFRLEPELGLVRVSSESGDSESSSTIIQIGTGVFALKSAGSNTIYFGGRLGFTRLSESASFGNSENEDSSTNVFLGPATGGEHFFGEHFSLGGEVQLLYTSFGDDDASASVLRTRPVFFVRWHL